jgi:hypothetical protein
VPSAGNLEGKKICVERRNVMTARPHGSVAAFLHRANLFAAVLAIMAGIFGMHVMTGTHSMHSPDAAIATTATAAAAGMVHAGPSGGHTGHQTPGTSSDAQVSGGQDAGGASVEQCPDTGGCPGMQAMTAACIPSANTGSLTAPLPGTAVLAVNNNSGALLVGAGRWSYLPGSPSPGELCISRT